MPPHVSKARARFLCDRCGAESAQWHGKCPSCGEWNALVEYRPETAGWTVRRAPAQAPVPLAEAGLSGQTRYTSGLPEFDRVLGGGLVPGALMLLSGDPGIGKSTLLLQVASSFSLANGSCLYVSGEESLHQIAMRGNRLQSLSPDLKVLAETDLGAIERQVESSSPSLLVVDSIQAMYSPEVDSLPGSVGQVRACGARLLRITKDLSLPTLVVGHVTKEGVLAGPRLLEHMVDSVLTLEGDRHSGYRVLRAIKNRFGATDEVGLFEMTEAGMAAVPDASAALLSQRRAGLPGSAVVATLEGSRPLLVEIQALVTKAAPYGSPRRSVTGVDYGRACLMLAVLEKQAGLSLASDDVYVNVPGGIKVAEPAADLGLALAIAGSFQERAIRSDTGCLGEVGLTGEIRSIPGLNRRLGELARRGFRRCLVPEQLDEPRPRDLELVCVRDLKGAFSAAFAR